jgi:hypothetical protein
MKIETVNEAVALSTKFIEKCKIVQDRLQIDSFTMYGCKETGAVRRASMDLTRILADLRAGK